MTQQALALLGALLTLAACFSLGSAVAGQLAVPLGKFERFPFAMLLGASVLHLAVFAVMALKLAYTPVLITLLAAAIPAGLYKRARRSAANIPDGGKPVSLWITCLLGGITTVYGLVYLANAWAPEFSSDGSGYHLGLVARYLRSHGFEFVPTNFYSSLSAGFEMLFVPAFAIGRHSAASLVHFGFVIALGIAVFAYGRRGGRPVAGACAALLVCLTPIVGVEGTSAYVDVAAALAAFLTFYATELWESHRTKGMLFAIGLFGGYCYAVKYTMAVMLVYAILFVAWKDRNIRTALWVALPASIMILPWMAKNWTYFHNPIAPFANTLFRNPFIHPEFERYWSMRLRHYELTSLWQLPVETTLHGDKLGGALGPVFLLAPIALFALATKQGRRLLVPAGLLLAVYTGNVGTRFLIPVLPFVALAMAMTLDRVGIYLAPLLVLTHAIASWPPFLHRYSSAWSIEHVPHKAALGIQSEEQYLGWRQDYRIARMIEHSVPEGRRVLTVINVPDAYTTRDVLVSFQGAENEVLSDILTMGALADNQPRHAWVARFPPRQVRAIRVVQTGVIANPEEQWGVHEIRLYHRGKELQRAATWRLSSFPNPWDVGLAFDNSEATRWRTWETPRPGDFIKVNFGKDETVDEVRVETGSDNEDVRVSLEIEDTQGRWTSLGEGALMQKFHMTYEGDLQRAAAIELHARGIDYILMRDMDWCCSSFAKDPASFHLTVLGRVGLHGSGATLYRIDSQEKP